MERYIGLDVHAASTTVAVVSVSLRLLREGEGMRIWSRIVMGTTKPPQGA